MFSLVAFNLALDFAHVFSFSDEGVPFCYADITVQLNNTCGLSVVLTTTSHMIPSTMSQPSIVTMRKPRLALSLNVEANEGKWWLRPA